MNPEQPNATPDRETGIDADNSDSGNQSGLWSWVQNWSLLLVIVLPALFGAMLAIAGFVFGSVLESAFIPIGMSLQLASFFVASIWCVLGRRTRVRTVVDWTVLMLAMFSICVFQFTFEESDSIFVNLSEVAITIAVFCATSFAMMAPFCFIHKRYEFSLLNHERCERLTIMDLLTVMAIVAICFGVLRLGGFLATGEHKIGDQDMAVDASQMESIIVGAIKVLVFVMFGCITGLLLGIPFVIWVRYCRRYTVFGNLLGWSIAQFGFLIFSVVALLFSGTRWPGRDLFVLSLSFILFQAVVFLELIALAIIRFPQGDLLVRRGSP